MVKKQLVTKIHIYIFDSFSSFFLFPIFLLEAEDESPSGDLLGTGEDSL
jgi:hypothetical protein